MDRVETHRPSGETRSRSDHRSGDNYSANRPRSRSPRGRRSSRSRSRSPRRRSYTRSRSRTPPRRGRSRSPAYDSYGGNNRSQEERNLEKDAMVQNIKEGSQQERRVYVGNLSYDVKWHHLKEYMSAGMRLWMSEMVGWLKLGYSGKNSLCGCSSVTKWDVQGTIVEYSTREEAQNAINTLTNQILMGRLVYIREDREQEPRFNNSSSGGAGYQPRGGFRGGYSAGRGGYDSYSSGSHGYGGGTQLFINHLPYTVGWQDLKDLFRPVGNVVRADVHSTFDGRPKGTGIVVFETPAEAQAAIHQFNGYDLQGRNIEVREDRFPQNGLGGRFGGRGSFGGRGGFRGGFQSSRGGFGAGRGGFQGGYNSYQTQPVVKTNEFTDGALGGGSPSATIHVDNLPWSTSNDDLVELFTTIGKVERAEMQFEPNGRSKGAGVVQFDGQEMAEMAISKFGGYMYGGRPLRLSYVRYVSGDDTGMGVNAGMGGDATMIDSSYNGM
ncbi:putative RNA-binding protein [Neolecta irregularis DAH-3]|uniref:Putative RNA-binding protein n=1 Tax=Neolecta irregularis (strain DAH-3) TaxID=1198029 RepID=A0A1U7LIK3_NEOID|nr:putative RNA-binding protein [Neolecta irregularis DAH-3]|eukprot:OLL22485.1 putative RNA-binding protein [Neolecta irregularis DAH-3]